MDSLRRAVARFCGRLPGTTGLAGYVVCCVLPCRCCWKGLEKTLRFGKDSKHEDGEPLVKCNVGTRKVLVLGLDGSGKSSWLWLCDHPEDSSLRSGELLQPTSGVQRLTRKHVRSSVGEETNVSVDLELTEVGGGEQIRPFWGHYVAQDLAVLVFFADASDSDRLEEAAEALAEVCRAVVAQAKAPSARLLLVAMNTFAVGAEPSSDIHEVMRRAAEDVVAFDGVRILEADLVGAAGREPADALLSHVADLALGAGPPLRWRR